SPHGRQIMGVLLFQDLAVIPLLVLIPALALTGEEIAGAVGVALAKAGVVLAIVLFVGQRLMRPLFNLVARQKSSELFVLFALMLSLKLLVIYGLATALRNARPTALRAALALAPAGEFGFVLLALAARDGAANRELLQVVLAATVLSMLAAPLILARMEA